MRCSRDDAVAALNPPPAFLATERQGTAGARSEDPQRNAGQSDGMDGPQCLPGIIRYGPTGRNLDANGLRICACLGLMSTKRASTSYRRRPLGPNLGCDQVALLQNAADRDFARPPRRRGGNLAIFLVRHAHQRPDTNTFRRCDFNVGHCGLRPCNGAPKGLSIPSISSRPALQPDRG
jgi:hypothetical protein